MKRILSVLLALVMVIGMLPMSILSASAAGTEVSMNIYANTGAPASDSLSISWTSGVITFTGKKSESSTAIRTSDSDHYRLYASSAVDITCSAGNISKVVFTATSEDYAKVLNTSALDTTNGSTPASVSTSGNDVTVQLSSPAATYTIGKMSAQSRIKKVVVTYEEASDCAHTNTELQNVAAAGCITAGYTGDTFCSDCERVTQYGTSITPTGHTFVDGVCSACTLKQDDITSYAIIEADAVEEGSYIICGTKGSENKYPATATMTTSSGKTDWEVSSTAVIENGGIITADLLPEDAQVFELTGNSTDGFAIGFDNGEEIVYLGYSSYANRQLAWSVDYSAVLWTVSAVEAGGVWLVNTTDSGAYNIGQAQNTSATTALRGYAGGTSIDGIYLFKKVPTAQDQCVHEFGEWTVTEAVTCTTNGMREHTCGLCDLTESEYIEKLGHTVVDGVCSTCHETIYTLATTLADNDKVIIYYVAGGLAMTATASGDKLTGVAGTVTDGQLIYADAMAALTVEYVDDTNFYLISADGKYLTSGATGNSLTLADAPTIYSNWYLKVADEAEGIVYIKNTNATYNTKAQDMEYYNGFTTYSTNTGSAYEMQLYVQTGTAACEHTWSDWTLETASSCTTLGVNVRTCTTEGGCGHTQRSAIDMLGHSYTLGDTAVCDNCDASLSLSTIETVKSFTDTNTLYYFEGVVTYIKGRNVYIEDSTGGVLVYFTSDPSDIALGDKIRVCDTMKKYNGLIETPGTTTGEYYVVSQGNALPSQTVTIADLLADTSNEYLAERVVIENVTVGTINTSGNTALTDADGNSINIYKVSGLSEDINKNDTVTVTAIVSTYNAYQLLINPGTAATDVVKIENAAVYDGETEVNTYATVEAAYAAATEGQYIKLLANCETDLTLNKDLYIDVNGFGIEGEVVTGNYKIYGIDSATDNYTASNGYLGLTVNGGLAEVSTEADKYLMTEGDNGWTFHAYAAKLTHVSLDAYNDALGYKAQLFGDEVVMEHVTGFGFNLWVDGGTAKEYGKTYEAGKFETGTVLTLRLKNIMAADGGEMNINANAFVTFDESDGKITGADHTTTMKDVVETIETMIENGTATYTAEQIKTVQDMITKYESKMTGWNIDAIKAWTAPTTEA